MGKTHKTQREANDKVWDLDRKPEKAPDTLAILYAGFEKVSRDVGEVDQMFDKEFEEMLDALEKAREAQRFVEIAWRTVHDRREDHHTLLRDYEDAENPLEGGAGLYSHTGWRYGRGDECTVLRNERQGQEIVEVPSGGLWLVDRVRVCHGHDAGGDVGTQGGGGEDGGVR